ncbi:MAG: hypothetical protein ACJAYU_003153 [Bradymonadia bacterium]|jgi:hypothetical protein
MTALSPGSVFSIGDDEITAPVDGLDAWIAWRESAGFPPVSVANVDAILLCAALPDATPELLSWERALLAVETQQGTVSEWAARLWLAALDGDHSSQSTVWTALFVQGSAASTLSSQCMPVDPTILFQVARAERLAGHRYGSALEAAPTLPDDDTLRTAIATNGGAVAASLAFVADAWPGVSLPTGEFSEQCDPAFVAALASLGATERTEWDRIHPALVTLLESRPVPANVLRRAALHWYLDTRPVAIRTLADGATHASPADRAMLYALAAGARGDSAEMSAAIDGVALDDADLFTIWVRAETARQAGDARQARDLSNAAVDADPFFAAAYLTRASAFIALGAANEGLRDLEHLRRTFGDHPAYSSWIVALGRRLR